MASARAVLLFRNVRVSFAISCVFKSDSRRLPVRGRKIHKRRIVGDSVHIVDREVGGKFRQCNLLVFRKSQYRNHRAKEV